MFKRFSDFRITRWSLLSVDHADGEPRCPTATAFGRVTTADGEGYAISQSYQAVSGQLAGISRVCGNTGENVDLAMSYQGDLLRSMTYSGAVSGGVSYTYDDFFFRASEAVTFEGATRFVDTDYDSDGLLRARGDYDYPTRRNGSSERRGPNIRRSPPTMAFGVLGERFGRPLGETHLKRPSNVMRRAIGAR